MPAGRRRIWIRRAIVALAVLVLLGAGGAAIVWWTFFRSGPQVLADERERFEHGSLGAEVLAGIPYPIFMILPRVFPDLVERYATAGYGPERPGHGGYGAFGLPWREGESVPVGVSVKQLGYQRVTLTCAFCHTASYRTAAAEKPRFAVGGPGHTVNLQGLLRFLFAAANDDRFDPVRMMPEMSLHFDFGWLDYATYFAIIIPKTRAALRFAGSEMAWMDDKPAWGPGRDDAFNLPKYLLTRADWDDTVGNTDFPAVWRLGEREGQLFHAGGEATTVHAVAATSAVGVGAFPAGGFDERVEWLVAFMRNLAPPDYPLPLDPTLVAAGEALFADRCADCHAAGGARVGTAIPLHEIGTDPAHVETWTDEDARRMNRITGTLGLDDAPLQGAQGYVAKPLVGVWLLGPYLHNGAVPTLWDLLSPPASRPALFYRGLDLIDPERGGFVSTGAAAEAAGFRFNTALTGNGNGGHSYGTDLKPEQKRALIEYLKTL